MRSRENTHPIETKSLKPSDRLNVPPPRPPREPPRKDIISNSIRYAKEKRCFVCRFAGPRYQKKGRKKKNSSNWGKKKSPVKVTPRFRRICAVVYKFGRFLLLLLLSLLGRLERSRNGKSVGRVYFFFLCEIFLGWAGLGLFGELD